GAGRWRIRWGVARLRVSLGPLVAALLVGVVAALLVGRLGPGRRALSRDERALDMLTSSEAVALRLGAAPDAPPETHATYRHRAGAPLVVVTLSHFPAPAVG